MKLLPAIGANPEVACQRTRPGRISIIWLMTQLHKKGRVRLFHYINGHQIEVDPPTCTSASTSSCGDYPDGLDPARPSVLIDV